MIGGYDEGLLTTDILFNPVIAEAEQNQQWQIDLVGAYYDNEIFLQLGTSAIIDSGSPYISMPNADLYSLAESIAFDIGFTLFQNT